MTPKACAGILRWAARRGKSLPGPLRLALESTAGPELLAPIVAEAAEVERERRERPGAQAELEFPEASEADLEDLGVPMGVLVKTSPDASTPALEESTTTTPPRGASSPTSPAPPPSPEGPGTTPASPSARPSEPTPDEPWSVDMMGGKGSARAERGTTPPLTTSSGSHAVEGPMGAIGFHPHERMDSPRDDGNAPTLMRSAAPSVASFAQNQRGEVREADSSPSLATGGGKPGEGYPAARAGSSLRRLTPTECLPPETMLLGDNKPVGEYGAGDRVLAVEGLGTVVAPMRRAYEGDMVMARATGLLPLIATPGHPVLALPARRTKGRHGGSVVLGKPEWRPLGDLREWRAGEGDFLAVPRLPGKGGTRALDLRPHVRGDGNQAKGRATRGLPEKVPLTEGACWLIGLYVAEGCATDREVYLTPGWDEALAARAADELVALGFRPCRRRMRTSLAVVAQSAPLARLLRDLCGARADEKRLPEPLLLHRSERLLRALLRGYLDGDGYSRRNNNANGANTASRTLALQLQLAHARLGTFATVRRFERPGGTIGGRRIRGGTLYAVTWRREPPYRPSGRVLKDCVAVPVRTVEREHYEGDVCNVETTDNTYLVSNAVVHNCERLMGWPDGFTVLP